MKGRIDRKSKIAWRLGVVLTASVLAVSVAPTTHAESRAPRKPAQTAPLPLGSMYNVVDQIGARQLWEQGFSGDGVTVALIDTGFAPVPELLDSGKVVQAVDLSAEAGVPEATYIDTYGHGTHMAGIIAGKTPGANAAQSAEHPEWFLGVAPDADIVSVKVADNSGGADVSQVIAGVDWVTDHAAELNIKVLNLSYASGSALPYTSDPLTFALERAWRAGIVVVVAAGNDGRPSHVLASPAVDPYVIAVAAVDAKDNNSFHVPVWASSGDGVRNPDLAAPGSHIDSLRAPGSRVDVEHPEGYVNETIFRGSGSSQAAAVVSGAAALLLDAQPNLTPDQVKSLLKSTAVRAVPRRDEISGSGVVQVDRAAKAARSTVPGVPQTWPASDGTGLLEAARGPLHMVVNGTVLTGEVTVLGTPWDGVRWTGVRWTDGEWDGVRWTGGTWMGVRWTDASWTGVRWTGVRWTDLAWSGVRWTGVRWTGSAWEGVRWTDSSWTGTQWDGVRWTDDSWAAAVWDGVRWTGVRWTGVRWDGVRWTGGEWDGVRWTGVRWTGVRWTGVRWTGVRWTDGVWSFNAWSGGAWE